MQAGQLVDSSADGSGSPSEPEEGSLKAFWKRFRSRRWARRSLLLFNRGNPLRRLAISITHWRYFASVVMLVVVANSIFMLFIQPREPQDSASNMMVEEADIVFNIIFTVELVLQVLALGLIVPDPNEGRQTDIYTIGDELRSYFGFRSIPPVTIGNISIKAPRMSRRRLRAILTPFYTDDAEGKGCCSGW